MHLCLKFPPSPTRRMGVTDALLSDCKQVMKYICLLLCSNVPPSASDAPLICSIMTSYNSCRPTPIFSPSSAQCPAMCHDYHKLSLFSTRCITLLPPCQTSFKWTPCLILPTRWGKMLPVRQQMMYHTSSCNSSSSNSLLTSLLELLRNTNFCLSAKEERLGFSARKVRECVSTPYQC